jgi:hypothetical protein
MKYDVGMVIKFIIHQFEQISSTVEADWQSPSTPLRRGDRHALRSSIFLPSSMAFS